MNNSDIYSVDFTRSLPPPLKNDAEMYALGRVIAEQLHLTAQQIRLNIIYARIDELDEQTLDILAYDLHVDWYDYSYPIEVKRQTIKDSVKVHRRMGTKYAVETAIGAVLPGTKIKEWFEYGGKPYFFRIAARVPEAGITGDQQRRILERVFFYKNLRSHLESIDFETESTGYVRVGAYATALAVIEIWPELTREIEVTSRTGAGALTTARQEIAVFPELTREIEITGRTGAGVLTAARQEVEVFPELTREIEITQQAGAGALTATRQEIEVFPGLTTQIEVTERAGVDALTAARQTVEILPELTTRVEADVQAGASGAVATRQVVEIFPEEPGQ